MKEKTRTQGEIFNVLDALKGGEVEEGCLGNLRFIQRRVLELKSM